MPGTQFLLSVIPGRGVPAFTLSNIRQFYSSMGECRQWVNLKLRDEFTGGGGGVVCPLALARGGAIFHDKQKLLETK